MKLLYRFALVGALFGMAPAAHAQFYDAFQPFLESEIPFDINRGRNVSVLERDRPEYAPIGVRAGSFLILPSVQAGVGYSSNVYGAQSNKTADGFGVLDPQVVVHSDWNRNALNFTGSAALRRFFDETPKNETGLYAGLDGRYDIGSNANVYAAANIRRAYEAQYSGSFPTNAAESIRYVRTGGTIRGTYQGARVRLIGSADINDLNFHDARTLSGNVLDQDYRDRTVIRSSARAEYALTPDIAGFGQFTFSASDYDRNIPNTDDNRDNEEIRILGGVTFDLTALMRASVGIGYVRRDYDAAVFRTLSGFAADVRLEYFPSQITTVTLVGRRAIEDSASGLNTSGYFLSSVALRVDHEVLRNLLVDANTAYEHDDFQGITRRDDLYTVGGGLHYLLSRDVYLNGNVSYIDRNSDGQPLGQQFNEVRGVISATFQI